MTNLEKLLSGVVVVFLLIIIFGPPDSFQFFGFAWKFVQQEKQSANDVGIGIVIPSENEINQPKSLVKELKILSFEPRQKIYSPKETFFVDFEIKNSLENSYNITVNWFYNNTRKMSWFNESTEIYNISMERNNYEAWYSSPESGEWEVQLLIRYELNNHTFTEESTKNFKVI